MLAHAWHAAWLQRVDARQFPTLAELTDDTAGRSGQTPEQTVHSLRMWKAALTVSRPAR